MGVAPFFTHFRFKRESTGFVKRVENVLQRMYVVVSREATMSTQA